MTTVSVLRPITANPPPGAPYHPKAQLVDDRGQRVTLPFAPVGGTLGALGPEYAQVARAGGRAPLLVLAAKRLATLSLAAQVVDTRNPDASQEGLLFALVAMARQARRVALVNYGILAGGAWRITDLSIDPERRQRGTNAITAATVTLELTAASDAVVRVGAATGGATTAQRPVVATVTVRPDDTATSLAYRALGDPNRALELLDANGIRDPRRLTPGAVLIVPAA